MIFSGSPIHFDLISLALSKFNQMLVNTPEIVLMRINTLIIPLIYLFIKVEHNAVTISEQLLTLYNA